MARGSIEKKENKNGTITYYIRYRTPSGKPVMTAIGSRLKEAESALDEIIKTIRNGTYIEHKDIKFKEIADKWLKAKEKEVVNGDLRPVTYSAYKPAVKRLKEFVTATNKKDNPIAWLKDYKLKTISPELCDRVCAEIAPELASATRIKNIMVLKSILNLAVKWGYLPSNPAQFVKQPKKQTREMDSLSIDELAKIIAKVRPEYKTLVITSMMSGLRLSEVLGLRWGDIDFNSAKIYVRNVSVQCRFYEPKTEKSRRQIMIGVKLLEELKLHQLKQAVELESNPNDLLFPGKNGNSLDGRNLSRRVLHPAIQMAGIRRIERPFHALRHSYVSALIDQGADIKVIQSQVGHSSAKITWDVYSHLYPDKGRNEINRFEERFSQKCENAVRTASNIINDDD